MIFSGKKLSVNVSTSAAGSVRVELQDGEEQAIPGYALADCDEIYGDALERTVTWRGKAGVGPLAGKPVRLRLVIKDADFYSFQFQGDSR